MCEWLGVKFNYLLIWTELIYDEFSVFDKDDSVFGNEDTNSCVVDVKTIDTKVDADTFKDLECHLDTLKPCVGRPILVKYV